MATTAKSHKLVLLTCDLAFLRVWWNIFRANRIRCIAVHPKLLKCTDQQLKIMLEQDEVKIFIPKLQQNGVWKAVRR